jgi:hypothetical protein
MKTILIVYSGKANLSKKDIAGLKKYAFVSNSDLKVGDYIESKEYTTNMLVVKVLDEKFEYFNSATGELSNKFNSTAQWEIRELFIREEAETVVYGKLLNRD